MSDLDLPLYKNFANPANYGKKRALSDIKWIVLHYTGNDGDTDTGNGKYFAREAVGASAHYFVDEDSATQSVPDEYIAWHCQTPGMTLKCGCRNSNSLGVEMCSDYVDGKCVITEKTKQNAAKLVKWLMDKYNVPTERVVRHFDVCGKECPEPWVRNEKEWLDFKRLIKKEGVNMEELKKLEAEFEKLKKEFENRREKVYTKFDEIPEWGKATVEKLIRYEYLYGDGENLNISYDLLRMLVLNDRAGLYGG